MNKLDKNSLMEIFDNQESQIILNNNYEGNI